MSVWVVLAAAGRGERLGLERPKAFAPLRGRPLAGESLERLENCDCVDAIVVAAPPEWEEPVILLAEELGAGKVSAVVAGGASRAESVRNALSEVPDDAAAVLVHDAARPLISDEVVARVLHPLGEGWDGAVPVLIAADTLKRVDGDEVAETIDRAGLVLAQTPQAFIPDRLREALTGDVAAAGDCASLVEERGGRVKAVPGDRRLVKVTEHADLEFVESLLS